MEVECSDGRIDSRRDFRGQVPALVAFGKYDKLAGRKIITFRRGVVWKLKNQSPTARRTRGRSDEGVAEEFGDGQAGARESIGKRRGKIGEQKKKKREKSFRRIRASPEVS